MKTGYYGQKLLVISMMLILCMNFLTGCTFNINANKDVDNSAENTEIGDNLSGTEIVGADGEVSSVENEDGSTGDSFSEVETEADTSEELVYTGPEISIIMVGDMLMHTPVEASAKQEDGTYSYDALFVNTVEEIQAADLAIVNQEVIIAGEKYGVSGYPAFNAPFELGHDLIEAGFDVICHGTNHALDQGKKVLNSCLAFWEEN